MITEYDQQQAQYEAREKAQRDWISGIEGGRLQGIEPASPEETAKVQKLKEIS